MATSATGHPAASIHGDKDLGPVLKESERLRAAGKQHVSISTQLSESVGRPGVSDKLPEGYDWSKSHRGAGPDRAGCS